MKNSHLEKYFLAIHHWEQFLAAAWHALETLRYAAIVGRLYEPGDCSIAQRLHDLYNQTKHTESRITSGQMPPQASLFAEPCPHPSASTGSPLPRRVKLSRGSATGHT